jgi:hypothetical protein
LCKLCMAENTVRKNICIRKDQEDFLQTKDISLSPLVQRCIDKRIEKDSK